MTSQKAHLCRAADTPRRTEYLVFVTLFAARAVHGWQNGSGRLLRGFSFLQRSCPFWMIHSTGFHGRLSIWQTSIQNNISINFHWKVDHDIRMYKMYIVAQMGAGEPFRAVYTSYYDYYYTLAGGLRPAHHLLAPPARRHHTPPYLPTPPPHPSPPPRPYISILLHSYLAI